MPLPPIQQKRTKLTSVAVQNAETALELMKTQLVRLRTKQTQETVPTATIQRTKLMPPTLGPTLQTAKTRANVTKAEANRSTKKLKKRSKSPLCFKNRSLLKKSLFPNSIPVNSIKGSRPPPLALKTLRPPKFCVCHNIPMHRKKECSSSLITR